jgi:hypothetical protein
MLFLRDFDAEIEASRTITATLSSDNPVRRLVRNYLRV